MRAQEDAGQSLSKHLLADGLEGFGDDGASIRAFGLDVVTQLCERLLAGGAPGLHIYTLNRANASFLLWQRLRGS